MNASRSYWIEDAQGLEARAACSEDLGPEGDRPQPKDHLFGRKMFRRLQLSVRETLANQTCDDLHASGFALPDDGLSIG